MKKAWIRLCGIFGLIFVFFGLIAAAFFYGTFLASAAYIEIILGLLGVTFYLIYFLGDATQTLWKKRDVIYGALGATFVLAILIFINVIAHSHWGERRFDTTVHNMHSLSDYSKNLIRDLNQEIEIVSFLTDPRAKSHLRNLVKKYTYETSMVEFRPSDPDQDPAVLQKLGGQINEVIIRNRDTQKSVSLNQNQLNEEDLTSAIRRVLVLEEQKIYFVQGNGEGDIDDDKTQGGLHIAHRLLEKEGYQVEALRLDHEGSVPPDADMLVAWGAQRPVSETVVGAVEEYLTEGGNLVLGQDPIFASTQDALLETGWEPLLGEYGVRLGASVIVAERFVLTRGGVVETASITGHNYSSHPIMKRLEQGGTQFSVTQPVERIPGYDGPAEHQRLLSSSDRSWAELNISSLFEEQRQEESSERILGPHPIGRYVERELDNGKTATLSIFGDSKFASNHLIQTGYNRDLFLNVFQYILGDQEPVNIRPQQWTHSTLEIRAEQRRLVYFASIFIVPQLIILLGIGIWTMRRNRT